METTPDKAARLFGEGCNCAQSVLAVFSGSCGLDEATALRLAGGLGAGFRCGEICGAASGAALVLGLRYGAATPADQAAKAKSGEKTAAFMAAFKNSHGGLACRDLLRASGRKICSSLIRGAVELLEQPLFNGE